MGKFKTRHLMMARDRGQGYDKALFNGNPAKLTTEQLTHELEIRGLATWGTTRKKRTRFFRALCQGIKPGDHKKAASKKIILDDSGKTVYFDWPDSDNIEEYLTLKKEGRHIEYTDLQNPRWNTLPALYALPADTIIEWVFKINKLYNCVVGVAREPFVSDCSLGYDENSWGYSINLGSKMYHDATGVGVPYGEPCKPGDTVTVVVDTKVGSLKFKRNNKDLGEAFHDVYGTLYPAISICGITDIEVISSGVPQPKELNTVSMRACAVPEHGKESAKRKFTLDCAALGAPITLSPVSLQIRFNPEMVTVPVGSTTSSLFTMTKKDDAESGECAVVVSVNGQQGNRNIINSPYAVEGASIGKAERNNSPGNKATGSGEEPPEKKAKT